MPSCGDGTLDSEEQCDDGNRLDGDGCGPLCTIETGWTCSGEPSVCTSLCGNATLDPAEQCDGDNLGGNDCTSIPGGYSGGTLQCSASCLFDTTACILPSCGDGQIDVNEECDDGNSSNTDGCLNNCQPAACGDGYHWQGEEQCDDGNTSNQDACKNDCTTAFCGDGYLHSGEEQCDDGNTSNTDECVGDCVTAACGDGFLQSGVEECDDSNVLNGDGCSAQCETEVLPVLYAIDTVAGGWSETELTYAGDPHAPSTAIVAAANVETRGEAYVFTESTYHLISLPTQNWIEHGALNTRFAGVTGINLTSGYGVSWENEPQSSIALLEGEWVNIYHIDNLTGAVTADASNPQPVDFSDVGQYPPEPQDVKTLWLALENVDGWVVGSPAQICGGDAISIGPYVAAITVGGSIHIYESGECWEFFQMMPLGDFPPFGAANAPPAASIAAAFYVSPRLYVIATP
jgi:cysteine-rich repeat protein